MIVRQKKRKVFNLNYEENKRIRMFVASWMEHFPGLADSDRGLICCVWEIQTSNVWIKSSFIDGYNSYRIDTIQSQLKSPGRVKKLAAQNVGDMASQLWRELNLTGSNNNICYNWWNSSNKIRIKFLYRTGECIGMSHTHKIWAGEIHTLPALQGRWHWKLMSMPVTVP